MPLLPGPERRGVLFRLAAFAAHLQHVCTYVAES